MPSVLKVNEVQNTQNLTAMAIDSSGRVFQPQRPFIQVIHNENYTYGSGNIVGVGGRFTVKESRGITQSNGVFTLPIAGLYSLEFSLISTTTGSGIYWQKNSTDQWRIAYMSDADSSWSQSGCRILTECSANDTISFKTEASMVLYGNSGTATVGSINILFLG